MPIGKRKKKEKKKNNKAGLRARSKLHLLLLLLLCLLRTTEKACKNYWLFGGLAEVDVYNIEGSTDSTEIEWSSEQEYVLKTVRWKRRSNAAQKEYYIHESILWAKIKTIAKKYQCSFFKVIDIRKEECKGKRARCWWSSNYVDWQLHFLALIIFYQFIFPDSCLG